MSNHTDHTVRVGQSCPPDRPIIRRLASALAAGMAGGALTAVGLIASDICGIGTLTMGSATLGSVSMAAGGDAVGGTGGDLTGAMLLVWGMAVLFGFVGLAISIMSLGDWSDPSPGGARERED